MLYDTYRLLHCKEQIQMTSNRSSINVEKNKQQQSNQNDNTSLHSLINSIISYLPTNIVKIFTDNKYSQHHKCGKKETNNR